MKNTNELIEGLQELQPGTKVTIHGYTYSGGHRVEALVVELLDSGDAYTEMLRAELEILQAADPNVLSADTGQPFPDVVAALDQMKAAVEKGIKVREDGLVSSNYRGASYTPVGEGGSLAYKEGEEGGDTLYLIGVKVLDGLDEIRPAKGAIPRTKQMITEKLDLPKRRYKHSVAFTPGKFESVSVL